MESLKTNKLPNALGTTEKRVVERPPPLSYDRATGVIRRETALSPVTQIPTSRSVDTPVERGQTDSRPFTPTYDFMMSGVSSYGQTQTPYTREDDTPTSPPHKEQSAVRLAIEASLTDPKKVTPGFPLVPHQRQTHVQASKSSEGPKSSVSEAIVTAVLTRDAGSGNAWPSPRGVYVYVCVCVCVCVCVRKCYKEREFLYVNAFM